MEEDGRELAAALAVVATDSDPLIQALLDRYRLVEVLLETHQLRVQGLLQAEHRRIESRDALRHLMPSMSPGVLAISWIIVSNVERQHSHRV